MYGTSPPLELFRLRNKPETACKSEPAKVALNHPGFASSGSTVSASWFIFDASVSTKV